MTTRKKTPRQGVHLHLDCASGIAGDMFLASLLHLGVPIEPVESALSAIGLPMPAFQVHEVKRKGLAALHITVDEASGDQKRPVKHAEIRNRIQESELDPDVKTRALDVLERLAAAEAEVHGTTKDEVHYHELGGVDTLVDVVGVAAALEWLRPASVTASAVALGGGRVKTDHGWLPVPAPATVELLKGVPVRGGPDPEVELTTPTGAALLTAAAERYGVLPAMTVEGVGHGAGSRDLSDRPNLLRAIVGKPTSHNPGNPSDHHDGGGDEQLVELSANLDDSTGELAAHAVNRLMESGALDAWIQPVQMKKGRPGLVLSALARRQDLEAVIQCVLEETTTFGVRWHTVERRALQRSTEEVETPFGTVSVMVAAGSDGAVKVSPEYESCLAAARKAGVPLREVYQQTVTAWSLAGKTTRKKDETP
jgi:uncharacterized protein (TIGR00299 family) protein